MSAAERVSLRPAVREDEARLLEWRNDPEVRKQSFNLKQLPGTASPISQSLNRMFGSEVTLVSASNDGFEVQASESVLGRIETLVELAKQSYAAGQKAKNP